MIEIHLLLADVTDGLLAETGSRSCFTKEASIPFLTTHKWMAVCGVLIHLVVVADEVLALAVALAVGIAVVDIDHCREILCLTDGVTLVITGIYIQAATLQERGRNVSTQE